MAKQLDLNDAPMRGLLIRVPILCALLMVMEGLDSNIISYVGPLIRDEYHLSARMLGAIYSATIFASLAGAAGIAPLSDRYGRRPLLLATSVVLSCCSLAIPFITTAPGLIALRVVVGLAFGAAVPTTFALAADFAPDRRRALIIMLVTSGVALGYVLAGFASAAVVPMFGWRVLMLGTAAASFLWTIILFFALPESPEFLHRTEPNSHRTRRLFETLGTTRPAARTRASLGANALALLRAPYLRTSLLVWFSVTAVYGVEFMLGFWLPTLLMGQGYSVRAAGVLTAVGKIASIFGSLIMGWLMDRSGLRPVLACGYALGALGLLGLTVALGSPIFALPVIVATCFFVDGSFSGAQALTVSSFPPDLRATASGWVTGLARVLGGGIGTLAGGALIGAGYGVGTLAAIMLIIMASGAGAIVLLQRQEPTVAMAMVAAQ
ncbi:MFS transporter [Sphingomonas nostoxanthinifaciens]|uniref:MFS transporter n=1 Tax=Sphingomonas nostoxanthinifaciens TaxID=2872652 RepID=UPI001CC1FBA0|nr:MFS transporter [Sphingomonas nostoxanthinifaciens]UAK25652.1 MFS transporter [Sphingomonas nostoxanthinifaciens]